MRKPNETTAAGSFFTATRGGKGYKRRLRLAEININIALHRTTIARIRMPTIKKEIQATQRITSAATIKARCNARSGKVGAIITSAARLFFNFHFSFLYFQGLQMCFCAGTLADIPNPPAAADTKHESETKPAAVTAEAERSQGRHGESEQHARRKIGNNIGDGEKEAHGDTIGKNGKKTARMTQNDAF